MIDVAGVEHCLDGPPCTRPPVSHSSGRKRNGKLRRLTVAPGAMVLKSPAST